MSRTSEEELGRRRFQLLREQAVEAAIEKIRHAPAAEWHSFSGTDYTHLRDILGELWIHIERDKWSEYAFSTLTRDDIHDLLTLGTSAQGRALPRSVLDAMEGILAHTRHSRPPV